VGAIAVCGAEPGELTESEELFAPADVTGPAELADPDPEEVTVPDPDPEEVTVPDPDPEEPAVPDPDPEEPTVPPLVVPQLMPPLKAG
jgi:hypothetical protein